MDVRSSMTRMPLVESFAIHPDRPGDDPIFSLNQEATVRAARGEPVVNATIGVLLDEHGVLTVLPAAIRAVSGVGATEWAPYAPISGESDFLRAVQRDLLGPWPGLEKRAVSVATPGGSGAVRHAVCNFLEPGQALLTSSFYWSPYGIIADEHQRRVETFPMFGASRPDEVDLAALDAALGRQLAAQKRALLILNDPCHNPTGYSMNRDEWLALAAILERHARTGRISVLIDAAYVAYSRHGLRHAFDALEPLSDRVLVLLAWSASKTFTHYGLRVGALTAIAPNDAEKARIGSALGYASRATWSNCNRGGMLAIGRLLADPEASVAVRRDQQEAVQMLEHRVAAFLEAAKPAGLRFPRYDGGFFVTVFADDAAAVAKRAQAHGVFVVPFDGGVRIALCAVPVRHIGKVVDALAAALKRP